MDSNKHLQFTVKTETVWKGDCFRTQIKLREKNAINLHTSNSLLLLCARVSFSSSTSHCMHVNEFGLAKLFPYVCSVERAVRSYVAAGRRRNTIASRTIRFQSIACVCSAAALHLHFASEIQWGSAYLANLRSAKRITDCKLRLNENRIIRPQSHYSGTNNSQTKNGERNREREKT